jgi:hypothetical protein
MFSQPLGLDHGVGHPLLLLCHAKAPNYLKKKGFKDLPDYSKWPKVADAVIEASRCTAKRIERDTPPDTGEVRSEVNPLVDAISVCRYSVAS